MKIAAITHSKGGVGKSLSAYQVIAYAHYSGLDYLAIDCDVDNRTISTINDHMRKTSQINAKDGTVTVVRQKLNIKMATSGPHLKKIIQDAQDKDFIIIDTGGNSNEITQEAIRLSHKIITPISNDAITEAVGFTRFKSVLKFCGNPKIYATFCNVNSRTSRFANMQNILNSYSNIDYMKTGLKTRSIYKQALAKGLGIVELEPTKNKTYNQKLQKAKQEAVEFSKEVLKG